MRENHSKARPVSREESSRGKGETERRLRLFHIDVPLQPSEHDRLDHVPPPKRLNSPPRKFVVRFRCIRHFAIGIGI